VKIPPVSTGIPRHGATNLVPSVIAHMAHLRHPKALEETWRLDAACTILFGKTVRKWLGLNHLEKY
jgi:hypothetical protein